MFITEFLGSGSAIYLHYSFGELIYTSEINEWIHIATTYEWFYLLNSYLSTSEFL